MSKSRMRGHFRYLRFKTFLMTPRTPQCQVFWSSESSSELSGVPEDSNPNFFQVLGFTPTLGQSGVATGNLCFSKTISTNFIAKFSSLEISKNKNTPTKSIIIHLMSLLITMQLFINKLLSSLMSATLLSFVTVIIIIDMM